MLNIKRILAPTDFSQHAGRAVEYAASLAEQLGAELYLFHVLPEVVIPVGPEPILVPDVPAEYYAETEDASRKALHNVLQPGWGKPTACHFEVRWGDTVTTLAAYAEEIQADLVVISTHGRTGFSHVLMGSVAERIVREAPCPVLTIREPSKKPKS